MANCRKHRNFKLSVAVLLFDLSIYPGNYTQLKIVTTITIILMSLYEELLKSFKKWYYIPFDCFVKKTKIKTASSSK